MGYLTDGSSPAQILTDPVTGALLTNDLLGGPLFAARYAESDVFFSILVLGGGGFIPWVADRVIDLGLNVLADEADQIHLCSAEPLDYAAVLSSRVAFKDFGSPGGAFGPTSSSPSPDLPGRYVASTAVTNGTVTATGTATHWAAVDSAASRLLARGPVDSPRLVTTGDQWSLPSFTIRRPN